MPCPVRVHARTTVGRAADRRRPSALFGLGAAIHYHRARADAGALRRARAPRRRAARLRQPDARLAAGRRRLAAAAAPARTCCRCRSTGSIAPGFSAIAISIASMALAAWAIATLDPARHRLDWIGGAVAAALLMLNPDVLYLQSTPMTEPLLFGTTFLAVALVARWATTVDAATAPPTTAIPPRRPTTMAAGLGARRRVPDALRSVADRRGGDRARVRRAAPARVAIHGRAARRPRARAVAVVGAGRVSGEQQGDGRILVRLHAGSSSRRTRRSDIRWLAWHQVWEAWSS